MELKYAIIDKGGKKQKEPPETTQLYVGGYVAAPDMTGYWEVSSIKPFNFGCAVSGGRMYVYLSPKGGFTFTT